VGNKELAGLHIKNVPPPVSDFIELRTGVAGAKYKILGQWG